MIEISCTELLKHAKARPWQLQSSCSGFTGANLIGTYCRERKFAVFYLEYLYVVIIISCH